MFRKDTDVRQNEWGQPIGFAVEGWRGARIPVHETIEGARCRLEPLSTSRHAKALHAAFVEDAEGRSFTYLPYGPFEGEAAYVDCVRHFEALGEAGDTLFFAIVDVARGVPLGVSSWLRIAPALGSIEVGHLCYSPALQRTPLSTEAMYLMMRRVFDDWGFRRYEWKCDALNAPSRAAAARLGFRYEGTFRQQTVVKGRNRDTAWFSITELEWPALRTAFERWLDPANFDAGGRQRARLASFMPASAGRPLAADVDASG